jgi:16S rRNA processing protein RimM
VTPYSSNPERFVAGARLLVRGEPREVLEVVYPQGYPCVRFAGFPDATAAAALRGALIEIDAAALPALPEGEYYRHDLIGLRVVTAAGAPVGELVDILQTGANDVYVVRRPEQPDALLPAIADVVLRVDLERGELVIEPMPGLLD